VNCLRWSELTRCTFLRMSVSTVRSKASPRFS
jgi:hypothetical protein